MRHRFGHASELPDLSCVNDNFQNLQIQIQDLCTRCRSRSLLKNCHVSQDAPSNHLRHSSASADPVTTLHDKATRYYYQSIAWLQRLWQVRPCRRLLVCLASFLLNMLTAFSATLLHLCHFTAHARQISWHCKSTVQYKHTFNLRPLACSHLACHNSQCRQQTAHRQM